MKLLYSAPVFVILAQRGSRACNCLTEKPWIPTLRVRMTEEKGFTLVELSIVLVIIGLLIGGILAAQSMISTAKVNSVAMQIGQFDAGVENFKTKYNYLPGDAPSFGGDGDGIVRGYGNDDRFFTYEAANFWYDFDSTQFPGHDTSGGTTTYYVAQSGTNKNVPISKLGKNNAYFLVFPSSPTGLQTVDPNYPGNYYIIIDPSQTQNAGYPGSEMITTTSANSPVKPADAFALDKKIDDGIGTSGNVYSGSLLYEPNASAALTTCSSAAGVYNLTKITYECTPMIRVGASTSDPQ